MKTKSIFLWLLLALINYSVKGQWTDNGTTLYPTNRENILLGELGSSSSKTFEIRSEESSDAVIRLNDFDNDENLYRAWDIERFGSALAIKYGSSSSSGVSTSTKFFYTKEGAFKIGSTSTVSSGLLFQVDEGNIGQLESGTFGQTGSSDIWTAIGGNPNISGLDDFYGMKHQWGIYNINLLLKERSSGGIKDALVAWNSGNGISPGRGNFIIGNLDGSNNFNSRLTVEDDGDISINGRFTYGSVEYLEDLGGFETGINSTLRPVTDGNRNLGSSSFRWNTVYATNGTIQTSDLNEKKDIKNLDKGLAKILALNPVTYKWKNEEYGKKEKVGLIAQEVMDVVPNVVYEPSEEMKMDENGNFVKSEVLDAPMGICYEDLIPVLIKAIQEQQSLIESQFKEIENLKNIINNSETLKSGKVTSNDVAEYSQNEESTASLLQNNPNPFSGTTTISYVLPEIYIYSKLIVYNENGSKVLEYNLEGTGLGSYEIPAGTLDKGIYIYSLFVDGKFIDSKKMIMNQ
jgi:hypothetical protein